MAMETTSLIVNLGSASKKYALFKEGVLLLSLHSEKRADDYTATLSLDKKEETFHLLESDYKENLEYFLHKAKEKLSLKKEQIFSSGVRVVAPGTFFREHRKITTEYKKLLEKKALFDPLHLNSTLAEIASLEMKLPHAKVFGLSDSAFHSTLAVDQQTLPFNKNDIHEFDLYRFGFHGLSLASLVKKIPKVYGSLPQRMVICHLGGGSSVTALLHGKSVATTMGYSPLGGVLMSTRSGDVDPGALLALMELRKLSPKEALAYCYQQSGLLGTSGLSGDIPKLLELEESGNTNAQKALSLYVSSIAASISQSLIHLNGIDTLVFSGTIGERSFIIRERILKKLSFLPLETDREKNHHTIATNTIISSAHSKIAIAVVCTDETTEMAHILESLS